MRKKYDRNLVFDLKPIHEQIKNRVEQDPRKPTVKELLHWNGIVYQLFYNQMAKGKVNKWLLIKLFNMWMILPKEALEYIWFDKVKN